MPGVVYLLGRTIPKPQYSQSYGESMDSSYAVLQYEINFVILQ